MPKKVQYICPDGHITCDINLGECPVCHKTMISDETNDWMMQVVRDQSLWDKTALTEYPCVVSYEYWRLRNLLEQKQPYGANYMVKDLMETLLKFYILIACAWSKENDVKSFTKQVLPQITTPNMSLGSWMALGREIIRFYTNFDAETLPSAIFSGLKTVIKHYDTQNYVHWRNEKIAHGALSYADDEQFQSDIYNKIQSFKELFIKIGSSITSITLHQEDSILKGYRTARNLQSNEPITVLIEGQERFTLMPFITVIDGGVYFFDNQKNKKYTQLQCYPSGMRLNKQIPYFSELSRLLRKGINLIDSIEDEYWSAEDDKALNLIGIDTEFTKPEYITEWFQKCVDENEKGVFSLEMPRGMGKSTFSERVNCLRDNPLEIAPDLDVRTYHMTRTQIMGASDFETAIETLWMMSYDGNVRVKAPRIRDFEKDCDQHRAHMLVSFMEDYLNYTRKRRNKRRIALFIDGLDEISDEKIWEYIPCPEILPKGVYIFLSYRTLNNESKMANLVKARIRNLEMTKSLVVEPKSEQNISFLKYFIKNTISGNVETYAQELIELSNYKILSLSILCKLVSLGFPLNRIHDEQELIEVYLNQLKNQYGETEYTRFTELLILFCTYGVKESLSLRNIAWILYEGKITFGLLGKISDLKPFLNVDRGFMIDGELYKGENRYRLANESLAEQIKKLIPDWKKTFEELNIIAINNAIEAGVSSEKGYIKYSPDMLVAFDRYPIDVQKELKQLQQQGAYPGKELAFWTTGNIEDFENDEVLPENDDIDDVFNETLCLQLIHIMDTDDSAKWSQDELKTRHMELDGVLRYLDKMSYSRKMLILEFVKKAIISIITVFEERKINEDNLEQYFETKRILGDMLMRTAHFEDAIQNYIDFLEHCIKYGLENSVKAGGYQVKLLMEMGRIYRKRGSYKDSLNMYLAANRQLPFSEWSIEKRVIHEAIAYCYYELGSLQEATYYINRAMFDMEKRKDQSDENLELFGRFAITIALILIARGVREGSDLYYDIGFNITTNLYRNNELKDLDDLIDLYFYSGDSYKNLVLDGNDYYDWAAIYFQQIVYMYDKSEMNGEYVNYTKYAKALSELIEVRKKMGITDNKEIESTLLRVQKRQISN